MSQNTVMLPTGIEVPVSSYYPNEWSVLQAIAEVYNSYGVMTYCKPKVLRKFGETLNADTGVLTTVATMYNDEVNETYSTTNDIDSIVSSSADDTMEITIEGHYYDGNNRKIFKVQTVTMTGQTPVTLSTPLCRATRYKVKTQTFGSEPSDVAGNISVYVSSGTTVTNGVIAVGDDTKVKLYGNTNQSRKASTSISYYDFHIINEVAVTSKRSSGSSALIDYELDYREEGGVWLPMGLEGSLRTASQSTDRIIADPYLFVTPRNSDVRLVCNSSTDNIPVKGFFSGFLLNDITDPNSVLPNSLKEKILRSMRYPVG